MQLTNHGTGLAPDALILVTGASGFVGGHIARAIAAEGYRVRTLSRRLPVIDSQDSPIDWIVGDLRSAHDRSVALAGVRGVVHAAAWVSLGIDPHGEGRAVNVDATRALLDESRAAGVERFVYTSSVWTVGSGSITDPADEETTWNLERLRSPYTDTKREAERLVLERDQPGFHTMVLSPGMVIGTRDARMTTTRVLLHMARAPVVFLPGGSTPVVDAQVVAQAHVRALKRGVTGRRYVIVGSCLSYREIATLVRRVTGNPRWVVTIPDIFECPITWVARVIDYLVCGRWPEVAGAIIAGSFFRFYVTGARADVEFSLNHPPPIQSVFEALSDCRCSGRVPWLSLQQPSKDVLFSIPFTRKGHAI